MAEIKIENVSKTYSSKEGTVQALKNVSLTELSECQEQEKVHWYDV